MISQTRSPLLRQCLQRSQQLLHLLMISMTSLRQCLHLHLLPLRLRLRLLLQRQAHPRSVPEMRCWMPWWVTCLAQRWLQQLRKCVKRRHASTRRCQCWRAVDPYRLRLRLRRRLLPQAVTPAMRMIIMMMMTSLILPALRRTPRLQCQLRQQHTEQQIGVDNCTQQRSLRLSTI